VRTLHLTQKRAPHYGCHIDTLRKLNNPMIQFRVFWLTGRKGQSKA